jgi:hypothetical protein
MPCVREIEHCPELSDGVRFGYLIEGSIVRVDYLVDWAAHSRILDCPFQLTRRFAPNDIGSADTRFRRV